MKKIIFKPYNVAKNSRGSLKYVDTKSTHTKFIKSQIISPKCSACLSSHY